MSSSSETLPTGKMIVRYYDAKGRVEKIVHRYGTAICLLRTEPLEGEATEMYMVRGKVVDATKYAKHALEYADMPAPMAEQDATAAAEDVAAEEHAQWTRTFDAHSPRGERGNELDHASSKLLEEALPGEAREWLARKDFIVSSYTLTRSKGIFRELYRAGAKSVRLLGAYDDRHKKFCIAGCVVELPQDSTRRQVLLKCDQIARLNGETGYLDDGQHYVDVRF